MIKPQLKAYQIEPAEIGQLDRLYVGIFDWDNTYY